MKAKRFQIPRRSAPAGSPCHGWRKLVAAALVPALLLTGCATPPAVKQADRAVADYFASDYADAARRLSPIAQKPDENFVLNNLRLGSAELARYDLDGAEAAFLRAYEVLNSFGVNDGGRTLGATLVDEKMKIWRGEPYERAMANFYLGLVYTLRHDDDNARGAYENALFKLRDYADAKDKKDDYKETESNFAVGLIMLGRTWQHLGRDDLAHASFDRVAKSRPDLAGIADFDRNKNANLVLVIDFGYGPRKLEDDDGSGIIIAPHPREAGAIPPPTVMVDGRRPNLDGLLAPPVDLLAMGQDRKWQSIDTIRVVKSYLGTGLIAGGAGYGIYRAASRDRIRGADLAIAGGLIATGLLLKASSKADIRSWEMLPRSTFIYPLHVPAGIHDVIIDVPGAPGLAQTWKGIDVPKTGDATYYFRLQRWNPGPFTWPPMVEDVTTLKSPEGR